MVRLDLERPAPIVEPLAQDYASWFHGLLTRGDLTALEQAYAAMPYEQRDACLRDCRWRTV